MGVDERTIQFLTGQAARSIDFSTTLTIGRQTLWARRSRALPVRERSDGYADDFFRELGAVRLDSLDASPYESATIIHDLNTPLLHPPARRYSVVFDGGSLEHVFDVRNAFASVLGYVEVGGYFVAAYPANNQMGHGFYQFSPELLYRVLSPENGFVIDELLLSERLLSSRWYRAKDPADLGRRGQLRNVRRTDLYVIARRVADKPPFENSVHQSDYTTTWEATPSVPNRGKLLRGRLRSAAPAWLFTLYMDASVLRLTTHRAAGLERLDAP